MVQRHGGEVCRAGILLNEMHAAGVLPTLLTYSCLISGCEEQGNWELALYFLTEFIASGLPLDPCCFNMAIRTCANNGQLQEAESILRKMTKLGINVCDAAQIAVSGASFSLGS